MKILYIVSGLGENGGIEKFCHNVIDNINLNKYSIDFLVTSLDVEKNEKKIINLGCSIFHIDDSGSILSRVNAKRAFFKGSKIKYDIVHVHTVLTSAYIYGKLAKKAWGATVVIHSHTAGNYKGRMLRNKLCRPLLNHYCDIRVACSRTAGEFMFGKGKKYEVIFNSVDIGRFLFNENSRLTIRKKYNIPENAFVLCYVGRFVDGKNHEFLLESIQNLLYRNNIYLLLIGDGPLKDQLVDQTDRYHISNRVVFTGVISNVSDYLSASDLFVFPSSFEGLPTVLIEAQANGLSIISSNNITDEVFLCDKCQCIKINKEAWEDAIISSLKTINRTDRSTDVELINSLFSVDAVTLKLEQLYDRIIKL